MASKKTPRKLRTYLVCTSWGNTTIQAFSLNEAKSILQQRFSGEIRGNRTVQWKHTKGCVSFTIFRQGGKVLVRATLREKRDG